VRIQALAYVSVFDTHHRSKFLIPQRRDEIVHRQRLIDLFHEHIDLRVHVVEAPAGYGKTTLLVDSTHDIDTPVCWYSIDTSDQDLTLFHEAFHIRSHKAHWAESSKNTSLFNEILAEVFAACVLTPLIWLEDVWKKTHKFSKVAQIFNVPESVVYFRLRHLGLVV